MDNGITSVAVVTILAVLLAAANVTLHYEGLNILTSALKRMKQSGRARIAILICCLLFLHILEIWVFATGIFIAQAVLKLGTVVGIVENNFLDFVYYSAMTFTTVGYGEMYPVGSLRFIAAIESLLGLMLITWSASFTYLEMKTYWDTDLRPE